MRYPVYCRNCGGELYLDKRYNPDGSWIHQEERTGLLGSEFCYYSPRADPILG